MSRSGSLRGALTPWMEAGITAAEALRASTSAASGSAVAAAADVARAASGVVSGAAGALVGARPVAGSAPAGRRLWPGFLRWPGGPLTPGPARGSGSTSGGSAQSSQCSARAGSPRLLSGSAPAPLSSAAGAGAGVCSRLAAPGSSASARLPAPEPAPGFAAGFGTQAAVAAAPAERVLAAGNGPAAVASVTRPAALDQQPEASTSGRDSGPWPSRTSAGPAGPSADEAPAELTEEVFTAIELAAKKQGAIAKARAHRKVAPATVEKTAASTTPRRRGRPRTTKLVHVEEAVAEHKLAKVKAAADAVAKRATADIAEASVAEASAIQAPVAKSARAEAPGSSLAGAEAAGTKQKGRRRRGAAAEAASVEAAGAEAAEAEAAVMEAAWIEAAATKVAEAAGARAGAADGAGAAKPSRSRRKASASASGAPARAAKALSLVDAVTAELGAEAERARAAVATAMAGPADKAAPLVSRSEASAPAEKSGGEAPRKGGSRRKAERVVASEVGLTAPPPSAALVGPLPPPPSGGFDHLEGGSKQYVRMYDRCDLHPGTALFQGTPEEWHRRHAEEVLAAPARGPHVPPPPLPRFLQQLQLEATSRSIALEQYRQEYQDLRQRGQVEASLGARSLTEQWVPQLSRVIEGLVTQFRSVQDVEEPETRPRRVRLQRGMAPPTMAEAMRRASREPGADPGTGAEPEQVVGLPELRDAAAGSPGARSGAGPKTLEEVEARAMRPRPLKHLAMWVPVVMAVPPPLLAKAVISAMLNALIHPSIHENIAANELPCGINISTGVVDAIGHRVTELVMYMHACELLLQKQREVKRTEKHLKKDLPRPAEGEAEAEGAEGELLPSQSEAAIALRRARRELLDLQMAANLLRPTTAETQVDKDGVSTALRRQASALRRNAVPDPESSGGAEADLAVALAKRLSALPTPTRRRIIESTDIANKVSKWDQTTRVQVGSCLLQLALETLHVRVPPRGKGGAPAANARRPLTREEREAEEKTWPLEPAFRHSTSAAAVLTRGFQTPGLVAAHPQLMRLLEGDERLREMLRPSFMPMLVEPRPWAGVRTGAFLSQSVPVIKAKFSAELMRRVREAHRQGALEPLYDGLTVLGNVPWRVNTRVLGVMERVLAAGGGTLGLPPTAKHPLPTRFTAALNDHHRALLGDATPSQAGTPYLRLQREGLHGGQMLLGAGAMSRSEEAAFQRECDAIMMRNRNESGLRSTLLYRMEMARELAGLTNKYGMHSTYGSEAAEGPEEPREPLVFFQPHNVDFRGRAYPLHPHLQHMGDDTCRGLLQFGVGQPLGRNGFTWLLLQAANLWGRGVDKLPLPQRLAWAEQHLPQARAVAADPLDSVRGGDWWRGAEKPWQLLGTCLELAAALEAPGGPAAYVSHQPVHQDGTCNGLQHYAALARDLRGGAAVNLTPADRPQDVYQAVADAVAERVEKAAAQGRSEAAKIRGSVDRKLVKQTVMTYVYGVTLTGAGDQIQNRLEERGWTNEKERRKLATYLAKLTFESMGDVFGPAVRVRSWLEDCAKFAASAGSPVVWTSPLGFPIEQPYRRPASLIVHTPLQGFTLRHHDPEVPPRIDSRRQVSGFPPNFIHCLDGAHMMMTAGAVRTRGACFAAVHDSFWTHAASVDDMSSAIRESFVELHSRPLLHNLRTELATNPSYVAATRPLPPVPEPGTLDLDAVRYSPYFFS